MRIRLLRARTRKWLITLGMAASAGLVAVLSWNVSTTSFERSVQPVEATGVGASFADAYCGGRPRAPVTIQPALVCDYYEHMIEHAPPRDPSGTMQRRELHYRCPGDPFQRLALRLTEAPDDVAFGIRLHSCRGQFFAGRSIAPAAMTDLAHLGTHASVPAETLIDAGRAFGWLLGDEFAAAFYRAGLEKAERQFATKAPGDPSCLPFLRLIDQTKALWRLKDYPALEMRFRIARRLNPPLSVESRRAGCLLVDALYGEGCFSEATDTVFRVQDENDRIGDLGRLDRSDWYEMDYLRGYLLFCDGRYHEAIPFLERVREGGGDHDELASNVLFRAYIAMERLADAQKALDVYTRRFHPSAAAGARMSDAIHNAIQFHDARLARVSEER